MPKRMLALTWPAAMCGRTGKFAMCAVLCWAVSAGAGQAPQSPPGYNRPQTPPDVMNPPSPLNPVNPAKIEHMREDERRKRLVADTAKLVELTNELKEELDKTSKDELSLDVVRKAAEIEKLAHDVKERMKS